MFLIVGTRYVQLVWILGDFREKEALVTFSTKVLHAMQNESRQGNWGPLNSNHNSISKVYRSEK